ncbi:hypothetical protein [Streptomyces sp. HC307]|uniref:hypothetical protein n=1 Tax=Streptomyces flavusporus TaxID=3385496 RepID=UPI003916F047
MRVVLEASSANSTATAGAGRALDASSSSGADDLIEAITHLAFYAGWPKAMTAITTAKQVFVA